MDSQWRLFRTKAFSDASVLAALVLTMAFHGAGWALYIDPLASFVIAGFLLQSGYRVISTSLPDLLDKTLDESLQMVIVRELALFFEEYTALHGVRSRRSGNHIYIELLLEFDGEKKMCEVQETINRIKASLEEKIPRSEVSIVPTGTVCRTGGK
jgi:divalent metal cation (Fe/Co/Zn/Cd) transporter